MPTLDSTVGGASANSYVSLAEAEAYFDARLYAGDWVDASEDDRIRALITATRTINAYLSWLGTVTTETQALLWPRYGTNPRTGYAWTGSEIPLEIKHATYELALHILEGDPADDPLTNAVGLKSLKAGPVAMEFAGDAGVVVPVPDDVFALIRHLGSLHSASGFQSVPLLRV